MTMTILVVDDQALLRMLLSALLTDAGYQVATATNGAEALSYINDADNAPDMIILDLMMPVMDGWGFLKARQQDPRCAQIPVIVLSADETVAPELRALGAQAVVPKAPDQAAFLATIRAVYAGEQIPQ